MIKGIIKKLILLSFVSIFFINELNAYIDSGTGSFMIQILIAVLLAIVYALFVYRKTIKDFFIRIFKKDKK